MHWIGLLCLHMPLHWPPVYLWHQYHGTPFLFSGLSFAQILGHVLKQDVFPYSFVRLNYFRSCSCSRFIYVPLLSLFILACNVRIFIFVYIQGLYVEEWFELFLRDLEHCPILELYFLIPNPIYIPSTLSRFRLFGNACTLHFPCCRSGILADAVMCHFWL